MTDEVIYKSLIGGGREKSEKIMLSVTFVYFLLLLLLCYKHSLNRIDDK